MTKPWRVDVVQCRGSAYDVGKQMATAFLATPRGRAYGRRKQRRPFAFSLKNAEAALETWAPNIWEELHGLADGLAIPLERAVAEYSNGRLRYERRGCSAVMTAGLYGRNYDYDTRRYDRILVATQADTELPRPDGTDRGSPRLALSSGPFGRLRVGQLEQDAGMARLIETAPARKIVTAQLLQPVQHHSAQLDEGNRVGQVIRGTQFPHLVGGHAALEPAPVQLDGLLPTMNADWKWIAEQARAATIDRSDRFSPTRRAPHLDSLWHRNPCVHAPSPGFVSPLNVLSRRGKAPP